MGKLRLQRADSSPPASGDLSYASGGSQSFADTEERSTQEQDPKTRGSKEFPL